MITGTTRLYAIIGDPVAHVRVPMAFNAYFEKHRIDAVCFAIHIGRSELAAGWNGLKAIRNLDGFIVTAPHKAESGQLCDRLVGDATHIGIVNAVRREADGSYSGALFDGRGFVAGLQDEGHEVAGKRVYISGAGGAGTALSFALAASGAAAITLHNRTRAKAEKLAAHVGATYSDCDVTVGSADASGHDIVCNATSLGLEPHDPLSFDLASARPDALVAEVIMKPQMTPLLQQAQARGHRIHYGTHMLDGQLALMMDFFGQTSTALAAAQ